MMEIQRHGIQSRRGSLARRGSRRGNAVAEYALVLALIVVVCMGNLRLLGTNSARAFESVGRALTTATAQSTPPANSQAAPVQ